MDRVLSLYRSSVGKKVLMAVTGFIWFGFLVGHMAGNLKAFLGADPFNHYAEFLREVGEPLMPRTTLLWIARGVLIVAFVAHAILAWQTSQISHAARETPYRNPKDLSLTFASRWMRWGGVVILAFIVFHLLHMTTGTLHPDFEPGQAYHNLVTGLKSPMIAGIYILAMIAIGLHLYHGVWSLFQTLGANHPKYAHLRRPFAVIMALVVFFGFISIPVAVVSGILSQ